MTISKDEKDGPRSKRRVKSKKTIKTNVMKVHLGIVGGKEPRKARCNATDAGDNRIKSSRHLKEKKKPLSQKAPVKI